MPVANYAEVQKALRGIAAKGRKVEGRAARELGREAQWQARALLTAQSHARGTKTPSSPGQPPAKITGNLAGKVRVSGVSRDRGRGYSVVRVTSNAVYARIQERGGMTGRGHRTYLPPRPYMRPARLLTQRHIARIARQAWESA